MEPPAYRVPVCEAPVKIIHRDDHLLIVEKPPFLLSVPGKGPENSDCVIARLKRDYPTVRLVHRLDLDTSGIMVFALTHQAQSHLGREFQERRVYKRYIAVVTGKPEPESGVVELPIAPDWDNRPRQKVDHGKGKPAQTQYNVLAHDKKRDTSLVELHPLTGRSHQLRLHMQAIGHSILGCDLYGPAVKTNKKERLMLHACDLGFHDPASGLWRQWSCQPSWSD